MRSVQAIRILIPFTSQYGITSKHDARKAQGNRTSTGQPALIQEAGVEGYQQNESNPCSDLSPLNRASSLAESA
jgi:hypothetical protein